jgi:hypothetical protein
VSMSVGPSCVMPVQCERSEAHERKKRENPLPRAYTVLCRFISPNLSVGLRKAYGFYTVFSLFRTENCGFFCVFSAFFFRPYANNVHREVPESAQNTAFLNPLFLNRRSVSLYRILRSLILITCLDAVGKKRGKTAEKTAVFSAKKISRKLYKNPF